MDIKIQEHKMHINRTDIHDGAIVKHINHIEREFGDGFEFLKKYPKSVTVFGSSMLRDGNPAIENAEELAKRIVKELNYAVVTGGGPGIMEASNKGAFKAGGSSIGLNISLPHEKDPNPYLTHSIKFSYFFSRKVMLTFAAESYVFFPGGFGTCDELFSILTLIQTGKIPRVPIILIDSKFWNPIIEVLGKMMGDTYHTIDKKDLELFEITDSLDRAIEIIRSAPQSEWWRVIN